MSYLQSASDFEAKEKIQMILKYPKQEQTEVQNLSDKIQALKAELETTKRKFKTIQNSIDNTNLKIIRNDKSIEIRQPNLDMKMDQEYTSDDMIIEEKQPNNSKKIIDMAYREVGNLYMTKKQYDKAKRTTQGEYSGWKDEREDTNLNLQNVRSQLMTEDTLLFADKIKFKAKSI